MWFRQSKNGNLEVIGKIICKKFLFTQKAAGKQFWFSHNPMTTLQNYPNSSFAMELNWLKDSYGLSQLTQANFVKSGAYWYFVP